MDGKSILITGGTGTFGSAYVEHILSRYKPKRLIVFSRDEYKQYLQRQIFTDPCMRFFIGDVRDPERLRMAFRGVDVIVHAAALKHVPSGEYNPIEVIKTNVQGAQNVIVAAIEAKVEKVVALSTDKAVNPINLYGASKLCAEKLFIHANMLSGNLGTIFSCVRYGNVANSRGSVIPFFRGEALSGEIPITHPDMTRFLLTVEDGVKLVERALSSMVGGEVFVAKAPSVKITDLARAIDPAAEHKIIGIRPGEKMHESLISCEEAERSYDLGDCYAIEPDYEWFPRGIYKDLGFSPQAAGWSYTSNNNQDWLEGPALAGFLEKV